jgi:hypothetical protein
MYKFLLIIAISFLACTVNAQVSESVVTWDFPVRYGTEEWKTLKSYEEQLLAYNIPDEIIKKISTAELVKVCLAYPEWGVITAFDDLSKGLRMIMQNFNGFYELIDRKDAAKELIKVYTTLEPLAIRKEWTPVQKMRHNYHINHVELLLSFSRIIEQFDDGDRQILLDEVALKYNQKKQLPDVYWLGNLIPTAGLCLNIIDRDGEFSKSDSELQLLKYYTIAGDMKVLDSVFELAKNLRQ